MKKKKGLKRFNLFDISNKLGYTLIVILTIVLLGIGVYALTPGVAPSPGHTLATIAPPSPCSSGQVITWNGANLVCSTPTSGAQIATVVGHTSCAAGWTPFSFPSGFDANTTQILAAKVKAYSTSGDGVWVPIYDGGGNVESGYTGYGDGGFVWIDGPNNRINLGCNFNEDTDTINTMITLIKVSGATNTQILATCDNDGFCDTGEACSTCLDCCLPGVCCDYTYDPDGCYSHGCYYDADVNICGAEDCSQWDYDSITCNLDAYCTYNSYYSRCDANMDYIC